MKPGLAGRRLARLVLLLALVAVPACSDDRSPSGSAGTGADGQPSTSGAPATIPLLTVPTAPPPPPSWVGRSAAPVARQEVAAAVLDGRIWVLGGLTAAGASGRVDSYDPAADRWEAGPDLPVSVHHAMAVAYRGEVVLVGGFLASAGDLYASPSNRVLALRSGAWVDLPALRRARGAGGAAVVGNNLVVVGGRDSSELVGPTEIFDGSTWRDRAPVPALRDHLAAVADDRHVYAVGGRLLSPARTSAAFERYDLTTDTWQRLANLPTARGGLGASVVGGRLVAAGGEDATDVFPQVEAFDLRAGGWVTLAPMATPRHGLAQATVGNSVHALVGGTAAGVAPSAVAEAITVP